MDPQILRRKFFGLVINFFIRRMIFNWVEELTKMGNKKLKNFALEDNRGKRSVSWLKFSIQNGNKRNVIGL